LFKTVRHLLDLDKFMAIVFVKDAPDANRIRARLAKVFDVFVQVTTTVHRLQCRAVQSVVEEVFCRHSRLVRFLD